MVHGAAQGIARHHGKPLRGTLMDRLRELSRREKFGEADYETEQRGPRRCVDDDIPPGWLGGLGWVDEA